MPLCLRSKEAKTERFAVPFSIVCVFSFANYNSENGKCQWNEAQAGMNRPVILFYLLVDARLNFIETLKDCIQTIRLDHEFLETFHAGFRHFSWCIAVKELCKTRGS